ncbi:MAG: hypothetical protein AAB864_00610 [Patescibacteria group bacterium]
MTTREIRLWANVFRGLILLAMLVAGVSVYYACRLHREQEIERRLRVRLEQEVLGTLKHQMALERKAEELERVAGAHQK